MGFLQNIRPYFPAWQGVIDSYDDVTTLPGTVSPEEQRLAAIDDLLMELSTGGTPYVRYGLNTVAEIRAAFKLCSPLPAIVSQKAFAFTKGRVVVWNPDSEKPVRGQFKEWEQLFLQPNATQSQRQFFGQGYWYQQKYGYCIIDPVYPSGYTDRPASLRIIPNWQFETEHINGKLYRAWYNNFGSREELDIKRLVFIKDPASTEFDDNTGLPMSRVAPLEGEVSNVIAALNSRGALITDRGAAGLISNTSKDPAGGMPLQDDEQRRFETFYNKGGAMKGQKRILATKASVGFTPMTFDAKQLGLQPEHIACVQAFCNTYAFPFTALAEGFQSKYSNSSNSRRDFHDLTTEPESMDFFEQLSLGLGMYKQKCEAYMDYSGVAAVQQSQKDKGDGQAAMAAAFEKQWNLGTVTRNDIREGMGQDPIDRPEFNKYKWELTPEESGAVAANDNQDGQAQTED